MAYASPMKIANGLVLDFTVDNADTAADTFLGLNASGEVTQFASVPRSRVSGGGNITEATSSVLSITGGTAAVLTSGLTIQVLQAGAAQSGYLSTTDWNTFNNKLGTSLTSAYIYVGNGSNVATGVAVSGDITMSNAGVVAIASGVIVNTDINASAAIAVSKLAAVTASRVLGSDGSGFIQALDTATYPSLTELSYVKGVTSAIQTQLNNRLSVTLSSPTNGDVITYNGAAWINSPSSTGVPTAGTTAQILRKIDNTNYNTEWHTLLAADLTDVSSTAAELNKLSGVTTTATQFNFLNTLSGDVQAQLAAKVGTSLTQNYMFVGDASNVVSTFAPGTNGYVLTSVSGVPTWVSPGVGGTVTSVAASGGTTGMSFTGSPITTTGTLTLTGTLALANGGTGAALADPGADRIMFWDDSAGAVTWLTAGNGTTITTTTLSAGGTLSADVTFSADGLTHDFIYTSVGPGSTGQFKVYVDASSSILLSGPTSVGPLTTTASGTSISGLNIPHGTAPSSPVDGDFWSTTLGFYGRVNGATVGPYISSLTNGNGTTANGSAVDLGGTITGDVNLVWDTGNKNWYFGQGQSSDAYTPYIEIIKAPTAGTYSALNIRANGQTSGGAYRGFINLSGFASSATAEMGIVLAGTTTKFGFDPLGAYLNLGSDATGDTYYRNSSGYLTRLAAGTNGHVLTLAAGIPSWAAPSGGSGLTVGTSTITSGTNTRVLYNNSGILGEYTVSGSGNVAMTTSPTFTTPILGTPTSGTLTNTTGYLFNNLAAATGTNTINNAANAQEWQWNTLAAGTGLLLSSSSTLAASNTNTLFRVNQTGANGTSTQTTHSGYFSNTKTGTSSTNIGIYSVASGGTNNWAIWAEGNNRTQVTPSGTIQGFLLYDNGGTQRGFLGINTSAVTIGSGSGYPLYIFANGANAGAVTTTGKWNVMDSPDNTTRSKLYVTHAINNTVPIFRVDGAVDTNLTASTEKSEVNFNFNRNKNWATGAITTQREFIIQNPTYSFTGASTITDAYTVFVDGAPAAGSNATITRSWAAGFDGNTFIGGNLSIPISGYLNIGTTLGTSGYGFRDNAGTMEFKNSGGSWAAFGGGGFSDPMSTRGDIIIRNASNVTARLGIGAANQSLVSDGTDISWGYLGQLRTGTETFALASSTLTMSVTTFGSVLSLTRSGLGSLDTAATFGVFGAANPSGNAGNLHLRGGNSSGSNGWGGDVYIYYGTKNGSGKDSNIGLHTTSVANWQSMERGVYLANRAAAPTTGIADGIALFAEDSNSSSELYVTAETGAKVNISGLFEPVTESGTTITLNETHRNKIVLCSNSGVVTVTVGSGKAAGWNCMLVATHATGTITLSASGTTINGTTVTTAQFETLSLVHYGSENYLSKLG